MIYQRSIQLGGVAFQGYHFWSVTMAGHVGEIVEVDDLDVDDTPEVAVRYRDGTQTLAERVGSRPWDPRMKGRFELALRKRQPFHPSATLPGGR